MLATKPISSNDVCSEVVLVTPNHAHQWLLKNKTNRTISDRTIERYARSMEEGRWELNGEAIIIASDGTLLNGQHRLAAVIHSGIPTKMMVTMGVDPKAFDTIDTGKVRTAADIVSMYGGEAAAYSTEMASAAKLLISFERTGKFRSKGFGRIDNYEVMDYVKKNPNLLDSVIFVTTKMTGALKLAPKGALIVAHYLFSQKNWHQATVFFENLNTGANLDAEDAVFVLRKTLIAAVGSPERRRSDNILPFIIKAWNAKRQSKKIRMIRIEENFDCAVK